MNYRLDSGMPTSPPLLNILANRQSAARSRERKNRHEKELAMRVERLRIIAASVTAELARQERRIAYMVARNKERKMVLEAKLQQLQLTRELNQAMKEEIKRRMVQNIHMAAENGDYVLLAYFLSLPAMQLLINPSHQPFNGHQCPNFMDFNQKK